MSRDGTAMVDATLSPRPKTIITCKEGITWMRDSTGIFVFDLSCQKYWLLTDLEADLWDWMILGHSFDQIIHHSALISRLPEEICRNKILQFLQHLAQEGILRVSG